MGKMHSRDGSQDFELTPLTEKQQYYRSIFDKYDRNKSGNIELKELKELIEYDREVPREIVEKLFKAADVNRDGLINFEEFVKIIESKDYKKFFQKYIDLYINKLLPPRRLDNEDQVDGVYEESYSCCPPPIGMIFISAFEMACFITDETALKNSTLTGSGPTSKLFIYDPYHREEIWRYFTYMFVHIGYPHLVMNLFVQLALGVPLEMVHRWWRVLAVYSAGVVAGSLGTSVTDPGVFLAGASGGVYALITAHIAAIIMNWGEMAYPQLQLLFFLLITGLDVGNAVYNRYWLNLDLSIGYSAHFAGAVAGLLVGIWVLRNFETNKKETLLWWAALVVFLISMGVLVVMNIFWTEHFLKAK